MKTEILGVVLQIVLMVVIAFPLGKYIARVYKGQKTWSDFMAPVERWIFKVSGIDPREEMNWKQFLKSLLILNLFWFVWGMVLLVSQGWLPLNPDGNGPQTPDQAFNTCISFMVNCNLQHYSGESGLTYFTQLFVIMLFQFITAATGMAAMAGIMKSLSVKTTRTIGNFWNFLVLSCTRILLPLSLVVGFILIMQGTPMGFDGKMKVTTLEGREQLSKSIRENSERLLDITGKLLNMTQVEAGKLQMMLKITKSIELIEYAIKANRVQADKFNIQIEVEYAEGKIPKLFVDSEKIAWVLTNLLSNAIRYSKEDGCVVIGACQEDDFIELYVQDFGKGITPRYHQSIFDRYFRVPGTKVQGSGLGLSISKDFVEAHGGILAIKKRRVPAGHPLFYGNFARIS